MAHAQPKGEGPGSQSVQGRGVVQVKQTYEGVVRVQHEVRVWVHIEYKGEEVVQYQRKVRVWTMSSKRRGHGSQ